MEPIPDTFSRRLVRWGLYPASWGVLLVGFWLIWHAEIDDRTIWAASAGGLALLYLGIEHALPVQRRWRMTWPSFLADLSYIVPNSLTVAAVSAGLAVMNISISELIDGPARDWPVLLQLAACLLGFEAVNYSLHRTMHETRGPVGRFLWYSHAAHHLPPRLYLVMHAVFHPLNGVVIQVLAITLPIWIMGYRPEVVTMFLMINGLHGLISHFNVDIRMGWANYLLVGTELHRYHHSAAVAEGKNYGATLSIFDQMFGTFVYRPGVLPEALGVKPETGLPDYARLGAVLALPFVGQSGAKPQMEKTA